MMTVRLPTAVAVLSDVMHWIFNGYQAVELQPRRSLLLHERHLMRKLCYHFITT
jgi:hypothetical protein